MLTLSFRDRFIGSVGIFCLTVCAALGQTTKSQITIHADTPGPKISPMFYGMMTEEINYGYDGGLYGELVQNRGLRNHPSNPVHWSLVTTGTGSGQMYLEPGSFGDMPSLKVKISSASDSGAVGVANDGFWGIPALPNTTYRATFYAKADSEFKGPLQVAIQSNDRRSILALSVVPRITRQWKQYTVELKTRSVPATSDNQLVIAGLHPGTFSLRTVSLFPPTYKNRANGNRPDIMEKLAEMQPSFLRLPGGNYLEGNTIAERFDWKATIGDVTKRQGHQGPWGYRSSDGMGLLEFLEWCEDLHMQAVLSVFAGYALQGEHVDAGPKLQPFVQDALDEIEYITGDTTTTWGARRAQDGHPKPFPLKYVEIGNEDSFDRSMNYDGRFTQFHDAIKAKYPFIQTIATASVRSRKPDVMDDHYYRSAADMERDSGHYDHYDRKGSKIFVGEWASIEGRPTPSHQAALGDAAWLIGLERNSDLVIMEAYAPLLVNVNPGASQWPTNLIGYDALTSFGSPSFYVQSMFAKNTGDEVIPTTVSTINSGPTKPFVPHGSIGLGTWRTDSEYKDAVVSHDNKTLYSKDFATGTEGWKLSQGTWKVDGGSLRQSSMGDDTHATAGDANWTDYTYQVKARKLGGSEGFLILFHAQNRSDYWQWNIGGWNNTRSAIQRHNRGNTEEMGRSTDTTVQTGRWYDIKIEIHGANVKCFLDGKLITEFTEQPIPPVNAIYAGASRVTRNGEVIVKVVNVTGEPVRTEMVLQGVRAVNPVCVGWELTGMPDDVNSIAEPTKVSPRSFRLDTVSNRFARTYPAYSVTVLRIRTRR